MKEAGAADGFTLNATYPNVNQYGVDYTLMMQKIQQDLAEINIKLELAPVEFSVWREKVNGDGIPVTAVFFAPDYYGSSQYAQYFAMMDGTVWYKRAGGKNDPTLANPETAKLLADALAAPAGIMAGLYYGNIGFGEGLTYGLKILFVTAVGGFLSPLRAAFGAAAFGMGESLWAGYFPIEWRDAWMYFLLVAMLVLTAPGRDAKVP